MKGNTSRKRTPAKRSNGRARKSSAEVAQAQSASFPYLIVNRHEAAYQSPSRSVLQTSWQDAAADNSPFERVELGKKSRHLNDNSALIAGCTARITTLVVGTGLVPEPTTGDSVYDAEAEAAWEEICPDIDITGLCDMGQMQRLMMAVKIIDGEGFSIKTKNALREPRIQLLESHRCAAKSLSYYDMLDGITLDDFGAPAEYRMCLGMLADGDIDRCGEAEPVLASDLVHHRWRLPGRPAEYRPMTAYKACLNTAHDIADILALEKAAVKDASSKTDVIETVSGEANPMAKTIDRMAITRSESATGTAAAQLYYAKVFGPAAKFIRRGDKHNQLVSNRPSPAWQGMMTYLNENVCFPFGIPASVLLGVKMGGVDSRRDLASAARVIQVLQYDFACELRPIRTYILDSMLGAAGRPKNWKRCEWHGPRPPTADAGRQGKEDREDLAMGTLSVQEYCASNEMTMRKLFRANALAKIEARKVAAEFAGEGITEADIFNFNPKFAPLQVIEAPKPTHN